VLRYVGRFADPVLSGETTDGAWNSTSLSWKVTALSGTGGGYWRRGGMHVPKASRQDHLAGYERRYRELTGQLGGIGLV
jgi:hypothetical protein